MNKTTTDHDDNAREIEALKRRIAEQELEIYRLAREKQEMARACEAAVAQVEGVLRKRCECLEARVSHAEEWARCAMIRAHSLDAQARGWKLAYDEQLASTDDALRQFKLARHALAHWVSEATYAGEWALAALRRCAYLEDALNAARAHANDAVRIMHLAQSELNRRGRATLCPVCASVEGVCREGCYARILP